MRTLGHCFAQVVGTTEAAAKFDDENYGILHGDGLSEKDMNWQIVFSAVKIAAGALPSASTLF